MLSEKIIGEKFYWICDCIAVKEILEYTGSIHQLRRWSQELMGYEFAFIHRVARMMKDVDGLSRHIDVLIHRYLIQASCMHLADRTKRPFAYSFDSFVACSNPRRVTACDTTISTASSATLPHFQLFTTLHLTLLPHQFSNHIQSQILLQILFVTLFPLKKLYGYLLILLLLHSVLSFLFGLEVL